MGVASQVFPDVVPCPFIRQLRHSGNECRKGPFDREVYKQRNLVERLINRLKQFRRLATRYEKRAANYRAMWIIAATLLWL
jgi:transposase